MESHGALAGKVAKVTLAFWVIKIIATTLGETGGDALSMPPINLGYSVATYIFLAFFVVTVAAQISARRYHPALYWSVIVATTTLGTTVADKLTREVFGTHESEAYGPTALSLFAALIIVLVAWHLVTGSVSVSRITSKKSEAFYWMAILVSNTLGTALGDWAADQLGESNGFERGALIFWRGHCRHRGALSLHEDFPSYPVLGRFRPYPSPRRHARGHHHEAAPRGRP
jgi:uncharacterized membrane-anchored protein